MKEPIDLVRIIYDNDINKFENLMNTHDWILKNKEEIKLALNYVLQNPTRKIYILKLIETGIDLNEPDKNGQYPIILYMNNLHKYQSERDCIAVAEAMIAHNINLNIFDEFGKTPLMNACSLKNMQLIETLVKGGADIDFQPKKGETAFFRACYYGATDVMDQLKKLGANINLPNNNEQTPLMLSVNRYNTRVLEWLIQNNVDVNFKDMQGNTALMYAIASNRLDSVEFLLQNGAQTNISNKFHHTPLQLALRVKNKQIISLLKKRKSDPIVQKTIFQKIKREKEHHI